MTLGVKLLFLLDPTEATNVNASEKKLNQMLVMASKRWRANLLGSRIVRYENLPCNYESHKVAIVSSADSIISRILYSALLIVKGASVVKKHDVHAIMCTGGHIYLGLPAYIISRITKRKCIIRVNEDAVLELGLFVKRHQTPVLSNPTFLRTIERIYRRVEAYLFKHVDWTVTHGPMDFERIRKLTTKVSFIPLWVDTQKFRPLLKRQSSHFKKEHLGLGDEKVILFVGRLQSDKDVQTLFYAFGRLLEVRDDTVLLLIGTGNEMEKCRELTERLSIASKVKFLGYIRHDEIAKFYNIADVYVLPSLWEEWSNTIMEAMASGIPVIATNVGANPYLVKDKETGFLVVPKNPSVLAEKIAYVLDHPKEMRQISLRARQSMGKYTKQDIGNSYKAVIERVITEKRR